MENVGGTYWKHWNIKDKGFQVFKGIYSFLVAGIMLRLQLGEVNQQVAAFLNGWVTASENHCCCPSRTSGIFWQAQVLLAEGRTRKHWNIQNKFLSPPEFILFQKLSGVMDYS